MSLPFKCVDQGRRNGYMNLIKKFLLMLGSGTFLLFVSNCADEMGTQTSVPVFLVQVDGSQDLFINEPKKVLAKEVRVSIKLLEPSQSMKFVITKDSDPDFQLDLSKDLTLNKWHKIKLKTLESEGSNRFTLRGTVEKSKNASYINEFILDLRNPYQAKIKQMSVLNNKKFDRIKIALNFGNKIFQRLSLLPGQERFLKETTKLETSQRPDIFILFFDTLRRDKAELLSPNMKQFMEENVTPGFHWTSGTSTVYTLFSMFHSLPSFLTYGFASVDLRENSQYGAFPLKVLEKVGYKAHVFGRAYGCLDAFEKYDAKEYAWPRLKQSFFGVRSSLLESCSPIGRAQNIYPVGERNWDDDLTREFITEVQRTFIQFPNDPQLFFISLYNSHNHYRWRGLPPEKELKPSTSDISPENAIGGIRYSKRDGIDFTMLRNNYDNSVKFADVNFKMLMDYINSTQRGRESIVILMSDHGELLGEKENWIKHGNRPYRERIDGVMSFRFGKSAPQIAGLRHRVFSTMDLFPTIIDYLGVKPSPSELMGGKSLLSDAPRKSAISVRSSGMGAIYELVIANDRYKIFLTPLNYGNWKDDKDSETFYDSTRGFILFDITDLNDNPVIQEPPFSPACDPTTNRWSAASCRALLLKLFPDGFAELFPSSEEK